MGAKNAKDTHQSDKVELAPNGFVRLKVEYGSNNLIIGSLTNFFGTFTMDLNGKVSIDRLSTNFIDNEVYERIKGLMDAIRAGRKFHIMCATKDEVYYNMLLTFISVDSAIRDNISSNVTIQSFDNDERFLNKFKEHALLHYGEYDYIIQHPPYRGNSHLTNLSCGLDLLERQNGRMVILEPATFLINVRSTGDAKTYVSLRGRLRGHVFKVVIDNYNKSFNNLMYMPYSITYVDYGHRCDAIEFECCGYTKMVDGILDCNLVGSYPTIRSILDKCERYHEHASDHIFQTLDENKNPLPFPKDRCYMEYATMYGRDGGTMCGLETSGHHYDKMFHVTPHGEFITPYTSSGAHYNNEGVHDIPQGTVCLMGDREELVRFRTLTHDRKIGLFVAICLTYDQHNETRTVMPWICDRDYDDEELFDILKINQNERRFIDMVLKKFERHSPWFIHYIRGEEFTNKEDISKYMEGINMVTESEILSYMHHRGFDIGDGGYDQFAIYKWLNENHGFKAWFADGCLKMSIHGMEHVVDGVGDIDLCEMMNVAFGKVVELDILKESYTPIRPKPKQYINQLF